MSKDLKEVKILMLGEMGVGKTSLILSLISEQFMDESDDPTFEIPARLEPITIPAEVTLEKVPGLIIDFSSREQNEQELSKEIEKSNVICLVYSLNDDYSKEQLGNYWLPKINEIEEALSKQTLSPSTSFTSNLIAAAAPACSSSVADADFDTEQSQIQFTVKTPYFKRPIVLVANKSDTTVNPNTLVQDTFISRLVSANAQIESCVQCSAKNLKNVPEVFYYAQKSVLYPTSPVYDTDAKQLTPLGAKCFTRIFKLCDGDNDGLLSDNELNEFQLKCFGIKLNVAALQEVKMLLSEGRDNLANNWITLSGFLSLQALFFKKGRHETSWTVLKKFGYDKNLSISRDYAYINLKVPPNCTVELSLKCFEFLQYLFKKHDKDNDGCLNQAELADLFSVCPIGMPWGKDVHNTIETNQNQYITYCGYLSQWILTTYFDYKTTVELLAYLGYNYFSDENQNNALIVSRPKEVDLLKKQTHRNVFLCYVYGRKKCGKTSFLQGLLDRDLEFQSKLAPDEITRWSCNLVQFQNIEKYLILKEINSSDLEMHEAYPPDVVILLYDLTDPNSFSFIADIFLSIYKDRPIPCILVGTKCDQTEITQHYPLNAEKFAEMYKLPPPQFYSSSSTILPNCDVYAKIVAIATYPKMYPMRSQIWSFFQKLGAVASAARSATPTTRRPLRGGSGGQLADSASRSILNPLTYFSRTANLFKPKSANDPDSMILRYTILTATAVTVAFVLFKMLKR